ncbi:HNH endonuclease signature motif containing protein [Kitasatospora purpeofusca]|uniref:HNH endonuclease signature motif containing protein n=1 Tax=Kitasatospora purpeofusca TaxID=67352 RepID=UPI0030F07287
MGTIRTERTTLRLKSGEKIEITAAGVREAARRGGFPMAITDRAVVISGTRFPVKDVAGASARVRVGLFHSREACRSLRILGFKMLVRGEPGEPPFVPMPFAASGLPVEKSKRAPGKQRVDGAGRRREFFAAAFGDGPDLRHTMSEVLLLTTGRGRLSVSIDSNNVIAVVAHLTRSKENRAYFLALKESAVGLGKLVGSSLSFYEPEVRISSYYGSPIGAPNTLDDDAVEWSSNTASRFAEFILAGPVRHQRKGFPLPLPGKDQPAQTEEKPLPAAPSKGVPGTGLATVPAQRAVSSYRVRVEALERVQARVGRQQRSTEVEQVVRSKEARALVIERSGGGCENPQCGNPDFREVTPAGLPILQVDHVLDLSPGGEDHPVNMAALCPNCHAVKTHGVRAEEFRTELVVAARAAHEASMTAPSAERAGPHPCSESVGDVTDRLR